MDRKFKLTGAILGVAYDVVIGKEEDADTDTVRMTGEAWGMPVDISVTGDEDTGTLKVSGTLLGNEFIINGTAAEQEAAPNTDAAAG